MGSKESNSKEAPGADSRKESSPLSFDRGVSESWADVTISARGEANCKEGVGFSEAACFSRQKHWGAIDRKKCPTTRSRKRVPRKRCHERVENRVPNEQVEKEVTDRLNTKLPLKRSRKKSPLNQFQKVPTNPVEKLVSAHERVEKDVQAMSKQSMLASLTLYESHENASGPPRTVLCLVFSEVVRNLVDSHVLKIIDIDAKLRTSELLSTSKIVFVS
jgi:hypothetical protein